MLSLGNPIFIDSHRDQHFTDALVTNASEYEVLLPGGSGGAAYGPLKGFITSIRMHTATRHEWGWLFLSGPGGQQRLAATPYHGVQATPRATPGSIIGFVRLQSVSLSTATEYIYATDGLAIPYMDETGQGALHVGLVNLDSKAKAALGNYASGQPTTAPNYITVRFGFISAT